MTQTILQPVARVLLPVTGMVAFAMLVKGYADTGDGFSAGVIAALGILLQYLAFGPLVARLLPIVRIAQPLSIIGLLIALGTVFVPVAFGDPPLTHWPPPDADVVHLGTLELITAVLFDIGVFLLVLGFAVGGIDMIARATTSGGGERA